MCLMGKGPHQPPRMRTVCGWLTVLAMGVGKWSLGPGTIYRGGVNGGLVPICWMVSDNIFLVQRG